MKAMILAAGYGARLWPLTADRAKAALPVLGKPLAAYVAEYLARFGIADIVINLHHGSESVRGALGDGSRFGVRLRYIEEPVILGTSGALDNARQFLDDETFVGVNGKIITDLDLAAAVETHRQTGALATLVLKPNSARERFSVVETREGLVTRFAGMPSPSTDADHAGAPLMFTGIQILEPRVFQYIPRGVFSHSTTDVYPSAIAQGERIAAHVADGTWYELSTLQRYLDISLALLEARGRDTDFGDGCVVDEGADVRESILWNDVVVDGNAEVKRAVIGDGVHLEHGQSIKEAVVVRKDLVSGKETPAKALSGEVKGDNFVVSLSQ